MIKKGNLLIGFLLCILVVGCDSKTSSQNSADGSISTSVSTSTSNSVSGGNSALPSESISTSDSTSIDIVQEEQVLDPKLISIEELESKYDENNKITIKLWNGFGRSMSNTLEDIIKDFEREYPYIDVVNESKSGFDILHRTIVSSVESNSYPHVTFGYPEHFVDYISSDIQYALDKFINSSEYGVNVNDYYENYMIENKNLLFKDESKRDSYIMSMPFYKTAEVMAYNKTFFDAFDLTVPATWDDAVEVAKEIIKIVKGTSSKLTNAADRVNHFGTEWNYNGVVFDFKGVQENDFYPLSYDSQSNFFITMVNQFGGKYTEMDDITHGYMAFKDNPKVIEALNSVKSMNNDHVLGIPYTWQEESYCTNPFKAIKTVMNIVSSASVAYNIPNGNKFEVGIAPIPYKTVDKKCVMSRGSNLAILKSDSEHALASWLLVRFLSGGVDYERKALNENTGRYEVVNDDLGNPIMENANVNFAIQTGYLPVTKKCEDSNQYQQYLSSSQSGSVDKVRIATHNVVNTVYNDTSDAWNMFVDDAFVGSSTIRNEVENIIPLMITGTSGKIYTAEEAIDYVYSRLPDYVK